MNKTIDYEVFNGIRKTIKRFCDSPFLYFTESDIHASLTNDIMEGNSDLFVITKEIYGNPTVKIPISLLHLEYPTNFRYKKMKLLEGYSDKENVIEHETWLESIEGDRGNFDLAILNRDFIENTIKLNSHEEGIKRIINKDITLLKKRFNEDNYGLKEIQKEILYSIEVKFIHTFNARNINMLEEVIKDNEKLKLALYHSQGNIKPINLIFCSSASKARKDKKQSVIDRVREYITKGNIEFNGSIKEIPSEVVNIFIESYFDKNIDKSKTKPIFHCKEPKNWAIELNKIIKFNEI